MTPEEIEIGINQLEEIIQELVNVTINEQRKLNPFMLEEINKRIEEKKIQLENLNKLKQQNNAST